jgi:hypothetical protein
MSRYLLQANNGRRLISLVIVVFKGTQDWRSFVSLHCIGVKEVRSRNSERWRVGQKRQHDDSNGEGAYLGTSNRPVLSADRTTEGRLGGK